MTVLNKKKSGLDINLGEKCSATASNWAKKTFGNRQGKSGAIDLANNQFFSNMLCFGQQKIGIASDGIGTKIELAERTGIYDTLGFDLVAMVADDLAATGFEPTNISNIIDVDNLDQNIINQLMKGLVKASNTAKISISGGEIAELGQRVGGYGSAMHFNWAATALGALPVRLLQPIDGAAMAENQIIIALQSNGFRSNGFSLIRQIMQTNFGDNWHQAAYNAQQSWGEVLLTPSRIYTPLINKLISNEIQLTGIAHITGGGLVQNLNRLLKINKLGAVLDNLFSPQGFVLKLIKLGFVSYEKAYLYWNMGNGMLLVTTQKEATKIKKIATNQGYQTRVVGRVTAANTGIVLHHKSFGFKQKYDL